MDNIKRDSDGFFSRRLACRSNDRSHNSTDSSLDQWSQSVDYQESFSVGFLLCTADQARAHGHASCIFIYKTKSVAITLGCIQVHAKIMAAATIHYTTCLNLKQKYQQV